MMKKIAALSLFLTVSVLTSNLFAYPYGGGTGEPNEPYLIYDANHMNTIGADPCNWDKHFKLMADIDLSRFTGADFNIIGHWNSDRDNEPFTGVFNGNGHTISNFTYHGYYTNGVGLFACLGKDGEVKGVALEGVNIVAGGNIEYAGALVGYNGYGGTISECHATGSVEGSSADRVGMFVGGNAGTISACYAAGSVNGSGWVGGLVGRNWGIISASYATTSVQGAGGLVGNNSGVISDCYARGSVTGTNVVGGLVGYLIGGEILNCYAAGPVTGVRDLGGLVGYDRGGGSIENSFYDKQTTGQSGPWPGTPLTTAQMQMRSTFTDAGWDFVGETANGTDDMWDICEGTNYPRLVWQVLPGNFICPDGVDMFDLAHLGDWWLESCNEGNNYCDRAEISGDETVDFKDFAVLANNWLEEY